MKRSPVLLIAVLTLTACASTPAASDQPTVVASIYPLGYAAERVLAPDAEISVVTPVGAEPHEFEPTPGQIAAALNADLFVYNGAGIDAWAEDIARDRTAKGRLSIEAIGLYGQLLPADAAQTALVSGDLPIEFDPHVWLDPDRLSTAAALIASKMSDLHHTHENEYIARFEAFSVDMKALGQRYTTGLRDCELDDIIVSHGAYRYMAERFGFNIFMLGGLSPEDEGSLANAAAVQITAKQRGIFDVFAESAADTDGLKAIAQDLGGEVRVLNPIESLTDEQLTAGDNYLSLMDDNLTSLRAALRCR